MKKRIPANSGFTLIEMMIVFLVIIVLAGMVLRLVGLTGVRNAEAITRERLERVAQALEEFRAIYGRYPPVDYYPDRDQPQPLDYEFPLKGDNTMPDSIKNTILSLSQNDKNIWSPTYGRVFTFGLLSYFFPRYRSHAERAPDDLIGRRGDRYDKKWALNQWSQYNEANVDGDIGDIMQNIESSRRILPFLGASIRPDGTVEKYGIVRVHHPRRYVNEAHEREERFYVTEQLVIWDGWDRPIHYRSRPPYDSYRLWSSGPDGQSGTEDDIVVGEG